jgi:hypothetical protein
MALIELFIAFIANIYYFGKFFFDEIEVEDF